MSHDNKTLGVISCYMSGKQIVLEMFEKKEKSRDSVCTNQNLWDPRLNSNWMVCGLWISAEKTLVKEHNLY